MFRFRQLMAVLMMVWTPLVASTSLYDEDKFKSFVADKKAVQVGDGITILIYETTQAASSAGEGSSNDFSIAGSATVQDRHWSSGASLGSSNSGDAATKRNGFIKASITAVVTSKDDSGGLFLEGRQQLVINDEVQTIRVRGTVRPEDIRGDNTVPSFRLQNADISIDGEGTVTDGKRRNVFARLFKWLGIIE